MKTTLIIILLAATCAFGKEPLFLLHEMDRQPTESIMVMDFDGDGRLDVGSGAFWYKAPDWTRTEYLNPPMPGVPLGGTNAQLVMDVNKDGHNDVIIGRWGAGGIWCYQNPGKPGEKWNAAKITDTRDLEGLLAVDVDGDGETDILPSIWSNTPCYWIRVADGKFTIRPVGQKGMLHGLGFADLDGDGKKDILTGRGWFRQIDLAKDQWEYQADFGAIHEASIPMQAYDLNADGLMDVIYGEAHKYGLFWLEQKVEGGKRSWIQHEIDTMYSQNHVVVMGDLNADGKPEIVTGKRFLHNHGDAGDYDPIHINYYTVEAGKEPKFTRYPLAFNSIVSLGLPCEIVDLDGDGDQDIVVGGQTGQYWFENLLINKVPNKQRDVLTNRFPSRL